MKKILKRKFLACGIGSFPSIDPKEACQFIHNYFKDDIIFWPQLTRKNFLENMYVQFSQGMPCVEIDNNNKTVFINNEKNNFEEELESSLGHYLDGDLDYFAISKDYACGFHAMLDLASKNKYDFFKGQIIGPISFGLSVKQKNQQAVIYNQELYQAIVKVLIMKASWQIREIKKASPKSKIIIFIDEPYLVSVGSSFVSLDKSKIISDLNEIIQAIHENDAIAGIHCCGNTDWSIILEAQIDILSFDAYNYLDNLLLYKNEIKRFLSRDGILAWGIVPTSGGASLEINKQESIEKIKQAVKKTEGLLPQEGIITPSCGTGTLDLETAKKIHVVACELAHDLSA